MEFRSVCTLVGLLATEFLTGGLAAPKESLYKELGITTPASPYSEGESALGYREPAETITQPPPVFHIRCIDNWESVNVTGDPLPRCRPQPHLWRLCYQNNPCGPNSVCDVINGTRQCSCMSGYAGAVPNCSADHEVCRRVECGPNSACDALGCRCLPGFVAFPPNCTTGPELLARCDPYPCGGYSTCSTTARGGPHCACLPGYTGTPPQCRPGPDTWRVCFQNNACGRHSVCTVRDKMAVCRPV